MKRPHVLSLLLVSLTAFCATAVAGATIPPEWITAQKQPYWDVSRAALELVTLDLATDSKCGFRGGKYVLNGPRDYTATSCTGRDGAYLWAKTCKPGPDSVQFTKRVWLPGPPVALEGSLVSLKTRLTFMEIAVNGQSVLHTGANVHKKTGRTTGFKLGWNMIAVRAAKPKTGPCNKSTADTGVFATLRATFAADVTATIPPPVRATSAAFRIPITVKNNGPSYAMVGNVSFATTTSKMITAENNPNQAFVMVTEADGPLEECAYYRTEGYSASCALGVLKPGETKVVTVLYAYKAPATGDFSDKYRISWGAAGGMPDPKPLNDGGSRDQFVCRPGPCGP